MKGWKKKKLGNDRKVRKTAERSNVSRQSVRAGTLEQLDRHPVYLRRRNCGNRGDFSPCVPRGVEAAVKQRGKKERSVGERGGLDRSVSGWRATSRHRERAKRCVLVNWFLLEGAGGSRKKRRGKRERRAEFAFFRLLSSRELLKRRMEGVGSSHREIKIRTLCPFLASPRPSPPRTGAVARCPSTRLKTIPARCNSIW